MIQNLQKAAYGYSMIIVLVEKELKSVKNIEDLNETKLLKISSYKLKKKELSVSLYAKLKFGGNQLLTRFDMNSL
jgi:hypothetical protein